MSKLNIPEAELLPAPEYIHLDDQLPTIDPLTDAEILNSVIGNETVNQDEQSSNENNAGEVNPDDVPPAEVSPSEALGGLRAAAAFFEQNPHSTPEDLDNVQNLIKRILNLKSQSGKQAKITSFFTSNSTS